MESNVASVFHKANVRSKQHAKVSHSSSTKPPSGDVVSHSLLSPTDGSAPRRHRLRYMVHIPQGRSKKEGKRALADSYVQGFEYNLTDEVGTKLWMPME